MGRVYATFIFCLLGLNKLIAQGTMHKQNGHFIAQLDFFGNYPVKNTAGHIKGGSLDYGNGFTNTDQKKYTEKGITVYGLVKSAVLKVDWWALFGEPTEQYQFEWVSSGYYDISFTDSKGKLITTKINKQDLTKYPDLLKRFDYLAPTEMAFEIKWKMGKPTEADIKKVEDKYTLDANFYSGLGLNYLNANRLYRTDVKNSSLLFESTGITPFSTPSIRSREEFLGISKGDHTDTDIKRILSWWQFCQTHTIDGFKVVKQDWPIDEMKAIAEKYLAYENGGEEPTPKEQIAKAEQKNKNTQAYGKDDFWGDAVSVENKFIVSNHQGKSSIKSDNGNVTYYRCDGCTISDKLKEYKVFILKDYSNTKSNEYELIDVRGNKIQLGGLQYFKTVSDVTKEKTIFLHRIIKSDLIKSKVHIPGSGCVGNNPSPPWKSNRKYENYNELRNLIQNYPGYKCSDMWGESKSEAKDIYIHTYIMLEIDLTTMQILSKKEQYDLAYYNARL